MTVGNTSATSAAEQAAKFKTNYLKNVGHSFDDHSWLTDCDKSSTTSSSDTSSSGGGGSNPLSFITTAISFVSNPVATIVSLATGKKS